MSICLQFIKLREVGARNYMTATYQDLRNVNIANSSDGPIKGSCTVKILLYVNNQWETASLNNVVYVPELKKNLISEGVITRKGGSRYFMLLNDDASKMRFVYFLKK